MTVGETTAVYNVEKIADSDKIYVYVTDENGNKLYLTGEAASGAFKTTSDVANAKQFVLAEVEGGYSFYYISGGADGGAYIAALSAKVCMEQVDSYYTSPAFVGSAAARDEVGVLLRKCITYEGDDLNVYIDQAFRDAITACKYMAR